LFDSTQGAAKLSASAYSVGRAGQGKYRERSPSQAVGQATSTPAGRNTLTTVSGGFAVQLFLLVSGVVVARLLGVEDRGHLALY
jgi:hypothetical protein